MTLYPSTSRLISGAVTGRRSAIRYEISDSCRISFSVSLAMATNSSRAQQLGRLMRFGAGAICADLERAVTEPSHAREVPRGAEAGGARRAGRQRLGGLTLTLGRPGEKR